MTETNSRPRMGRAVFILCSILQNIIGSGIPEQNLILEGRTMYHQKFLQKCVHQAWHRSAMAHTQKAPVLRDKAGNIIDELKAGSMDELFYEIDDKPRLKAAG